MTLSRYRWTPASDAMLHDVYPDVPTAELAALMGLRAGQVYQRAAKLGIRKSAEFLALDISGRVQRGRQHPRMVATQFPRGLTPWNKGLKGLQIGGVQTRFKPGSLPATTMPVGSYRISGGMLERKIGERPGPNHLRWRPVSRLVWEAAKGPVPPGHLVVFKPGMRTIALDEITLDRVECITRAENARRNHPAQRDPELGRLVQLKGAITRQVRRIEREQSAASPSTTGATAP